MTRISQKVCLLGDFAVGKTSLVRRFVYNAFDDKYLATIGVKVSRKTVVLPDEDGLVELSLLLWDLAGSEEFSAVRATYLRGAAGAILVCDLTRSETLTALAAYVEDIRRVAPRARFVVAANKSDLPDPRLLPSQVEAFAESLETACYLTSAKTGYQVEDAFRHLGRLLLAGD
ncbi:MAG: Rab family GTPase [Anaerolineae bacterium]